VSSYLFVSSWGNRLDEGDIHRTFYALSRQIGLRGISDGRGPRLHDMRHYPEFRTIQGKCSKLFVHGLGAASVCRLTRHSPHLD